MVKALTLIFNYTALLFSPIWGPAVIIYKYRNWHEWNNREELLERCLEMAMFIIMPLLVLIFSYIVLRKGVKWINENLEKDSSSKVTVEDVECWLMLFKYGNHNLVSALRHPDVVPDTMNKVITDGRNSLSNMTKYLQTPHRILNVKEKEEANK